MSAIDDIVELADKHGPLAVGAALVVYLTIKLAPEAFKYFRKKKEDEDQDEREERKLDSVHVVYGVDENKDVWMYSVFKTEEEAADYITKIKPFLDESIVILSNECQFNKPIKGFEAYNPYSQKYFGTERCLTQPTKEHHAVAPEKTNPSNYSIHSASANSYQKIRDWMENHYD